jgi:hypothetical protein
MDNIFSFYKYYHVFEWLQTGFGVVIGFTEHLKTKQETNSVAHSPQANYTDRATVVGKISVNFSV